MPKKVIFTQLQLNELKELIEQSMRQTDIAKHFNVTDDTIRRICREEGIEIKMPHKCVCLICGDVFYSNIKGARTCNKEHHRICKICGKDFIVDREDVRDTCKGRCTNIAKYGCASPNSAEEVKQRKVKALQKKYGVANISQLPEIQERVKQTCLDRYGVTNYKKTQECTDKIRRTNLERYGYSDLFGDSNMRALCAEINIQRYGTADPMQNPKVLAKQQATVRSKYGVDNCMQLDWVQNKQSESMLKNYGVPYGVLLVDPNTLPIISAVNKRFAAKLELKDIHYQFEKRIHNRSYDILLPEYNIVIEIDPSITHNSYMSIFKDGHPLDPDYHRDKTELAVANGYRCINVFDWDDWDKIISLIVPRKRIYARSCEVRKVDQFTADEFTQTYHIQGCCNGQKENYGLYYGNELVEIMTFGAPRYNRNYQWELLRLCTNSNLQIVGGASKLFKHFVTDHVNESIISYCDLAKFSGSVYTAIGMKLEYKSSPAKIWSKNDKYITDNLLRQRGFDQLFGTNYGKGTSNEELMIENNWLPVYDCGQAVFSYNK